VSVGKIDKEEETMCDYSLTGIGNRLAAESEDLMVHRFPTGSIGLASPTSRGGFGKDTLAVCVAPGAQLTLQDVPERLRQELAIGPVEEVTFVQLSANAYQYRDALRFRNGREIRLQELPEGLRIRVLTLSLPEGSSTGHTAMVRERAFAQAE
jgi:hypothetical protein